MRQIPNFDPRLAAQGLLHEARSGALSTLMPSGEPYGSLVNIATAPDGAPLLLLSRLAWHTKNVLADPRVSLMLDESKEGDPLQGARVTLLGKAVAVERSGVVSRYLLRQPEAATFIDFSDFGFYRIEIAKAHLVAGFGKIVDLAARDILIDLAGAETLMAAEADILAHINTDHRDTLQLYATKLLHAPTGEWQCVGCDPLGLDLQKDRMGLRLPFPRRVNTPPVLRAVLKELADQARAW